MRYWLPDMLNKLNNPNVPAPAIQGIPAAGPSGLPSAGVRFMNDAVGACYLVTVR